MCFVTYIGWEGRLCMNWVISNIDIFVFVVRVEGFALLRRVGICFRLINLTLCPSLCTMDDLRSSHVMSLI